jgi:hypothetical protein
MEPDAQECYTYTRSRAGGESTTTVQHTVNLYRFPHTSE